jgi:hypothetical protein
MVDGRKLRYLKLIIHHQKDTKKECIKVVFARTSHQPNITLMNGCPKIQHQTVLVVASLIHGAPVIFVPWDGHRLQSWAIHCRDVVGVVLRSKRPVCFEKAR